MLRWGSLLALAATVVIGALLFRPSAPTGPAPTAPASGTGESHSPLEELWSRPVPRLVALAVSPDGSHVVAVDLYGNLRCWDQQGLLCWEWQAPGADGVAVSRGGRITLAWRTRQPLRREVEVLDGAGRPLGSVVPADPVEGAAVSPDGRYAAVLAGSEVLFAGTGPGLVNPRRIPIEGTPSQVQFGPGDTLYVAAREPDRVLRVKSDGRVLWRRDGPGLARFAVSASADGELLAVAAESGEDSIQLNVVDSRNQGKWSDLRPGRAPQVRLCETGSAALLWYQHRAEHGRETRLEHRLAYVSPGQAGYWTKGGSFTAPLFVAVAPDGRWVVALDTPSSGRRLADHRLRLYSRAGLRRWVHPCPGGLQMVASSRSGGRLAIWDSTQRLALLRVWD